MNRFNKILEKFDESLFKISEAERPKVLIIDDSVNIQNALKRILIQKNYDVIVKSSGKEGIESLTDNINVVILDIKLPKMKGTEVYTRLKKKNPAVPIIFYSAYPGDAQMVSKCLSLKPYAFIQKGIEKDIERLYQSIEQAADEYKCANTND